MVPGVQFTVERRHGMEDRPNRSIEHPKAPPRPRRHPVVAQEPSRNGLTVERSSSPDDPQPVRQLRSVAERTLDLGADPSDPAFAGHDPRSFEERRPVVNVLAMKA